MDERFVTSGLALIGLGFITSLLAIALGTGMPYIDTNNMIFGLPSNVAMAVMLNATWILGVVGAGSVIFAAFVEAAQTEPDGID